MERIEQIKLRCSAACLELIEYANHTPTHKREYAEDVGDLLEHIFTLEAEVARLKERVHDVETSLTEALHILSDKDASWSAGPYRNTCPWCNGLYPDHRETCQKQSILYDAKIVARWVP